MTREDIIRMAREAGMEQDGDNFFSPLHEEMDVHISDLERFAALVLANNPPQSSMAWQEGYAAGQAAEREKVRSSMKRAFRRMAGLIRAAEREACARICDTTPPQPFRPSIEAAHAIRARGQS